MIAVNNKKFFSGCFNNYEKGDVSGQFERLGGDPAVPLSLRNTADYRLPTFGPHGTKLGHFWLQWIIKKLFSGWFDNSEKGDVFEQLERLRGWSRGCTPPQEHCWLAPTYFWVTWHQTRAFLISVINEKRFSGWLDNSEKRHVSGQLERLRGWSCGFTAPQEGCRLPRT